VEPLDYSSFGTSDVGLVRKNNEDVFATLKEFNLYAIADGMGGSEGGEIAAHEAIFYLVRSIEEFFLDSDEIPSTEELTQKLQNSIKQASEYIFRLAKKNPTLLGMGTTLCAALFKDRTLIHAHVGDSRLYVCRDQTLTPLTKDHSLYNRLVDNGSMSEEEASAAAPSHILARAVGTSENIDAELGFFYAQEGDRFLLCSDGLTDLVPEDQINNCLNKGSSDKETTQELIELAKQAGGSDNITVIIITAKAYAHLPG